MADIGDNGPPGDRWVDYRHALQVAIRDSELLSPRAKNLGVMICTYMDYDGTGSTVSARRLAEITGYGVNTIKKATDTIETTGLMLIRRGSRKVGTIYTTGQTYEEAILTYVKGARKRGGNSKDLPAFVTVSGDKDGPYVTSSGDKDNVLSPCFGDKGQKTDHETVTLSPDNPLLSLPGVTEDKKNRKKEEEEAVFDLQTDLEDFTGKADQPQNESPSEPGEVSPDQDKPKPVNSYDSITSALHGDAKETERLISGLMQATNKNKAVAIQAIAQAFKTYGSGLSVAFFEDLRGEANVEPQKFIPFWLGKLKKSNPADRFDWSPGQLTAHGERPTDWAQHGRNGGGL